MRAANYNPAEDEDLLPNSEFYLARRKKQGMRGRCEVAYVRSRRVLARAGQALKKCVRDAWNEYMGYYDPDDVEGALRRAEKRRAANSGRDNSAPYARWSSQLPRGKTVNGPEF